jgi:hypothetical protein
VDFNKHIFVYWAKRQNQVQWAIAQSYYCTSPAGFSATLAGESCEVRRKKGPEN